MAVQNDDREQELIRLAGLRAGSSRSGIDAFLDFSANGTRYAAPIELKSSTSRSVSTARDVGPQHIEKWRQRIWVFAFYDPSGSRLESTLVLGPKDMEPWIGRVESYIAPDIAIGERVAERLSVEDLHVICGQKVIYRLADAQALHKRQWTNRRYVDEMDLDDGYSPDKMLEILKARAKYLNARGATLNNPHIPAAYWSTFEQRLQLKEIGDTRLRAAVRASIRQLALEDGAVRALARALATR